MSIPELEWVNASRGLHRDPLDGLDADGVLTRPSTDQAPMRCYLRYWAQAMDQEVKLAYR